MTNLKRQAFFKPLKILIGVALTGEAIFNSICECTKAFKPNLFDVSYLNEAWLMSVLFIADYFE